MGFREEKEVANPFRSAGGDNSEEGESLVVPIIRAHPSLDCAKDGAPSSFCVEKNRNPRGDDISCPYKKIGLEKKTGSGNFRSPLPFAEAGKILGDANFRGQEHGIRGYGRIQV